MTRRPPYPFTVGDNATGQCSACAEVFYGEGAFDHHRRGVEPDRGCIDPANPPRREDGTPEPWWLDNRQRWHLGPAVDPDEYERRKRDRAAAASAARRDPSGRTQRARTALPGVPGTPRPALLRNPGIRR